MTTLKERFEKKLVEQGWNTEVRRMLQTYAAPELLSFFRQELLALAEEVEKSDYSQLCGTHGKDDLCTHWDKEKGRNVAATLIRSKADELK